MDSLYDRNGLLVWDEREIRARRMVEEHVVGGVLEVLKTKNRAFEAFQCEVSVLTPRHLVNANYTDDDIYPVVGDTLVLRPETTMGSYAYARHLLNPHLDRKVRLPVVVWQHGKSFRREQDQPTKHMRLKEFYQLELQILYGVTTAYDYSEAVIPAVRDLLFPFVGPCHTEPSDRIPDYSEGTTDVVVDRTGMEVCSISKRKDFDGARCLEVAVGTDRVVYHLFHVDRAGS